MVRLSRIFLVSNSAIRIKLHQGFRIGSLAILWHPHITIFIVLHLCTCIVDYITTEDLAAWYGSPLFSFAEIVLAAVVVCRGIVNNSLFTAREHQEFEVFSRSLDIKAKVRTCHKLLSIFGVDTIDSAISMWAVAFLCSHIGIIVLYRQHTCPSCHGSLLPIGCVWAAKYQWISFPKHITIRCHRGDEDTTIVGYADAVWRETAAWCTIKVLTCLFYASTIVTIAHFITLVRHTASATVSIEDIQTSTVGITDIVSIIGIVFSCWQSFYTEHGTEVLVLWVVIDIHRCWAI